MMKWPFKCSKTELVCAIALSSLMAFGPDWALRGLVFCLGVQFYLAPNPAEKELS